MSFLLLALGLYNRLNNGLADLVVTFNTLYRGICNIYKEKVYILFEKIGAPYLLENVNIGSPSSAYPQWYYDPSNHAFVHWALGSSVKGIIATTSTIHKLPILSMEILDNDRIIHDLTDFIDKIDVYSTEQEHSPCIAHLIGAWSLSSEIVLDTTRLFKVRFMNSSGSTVSTNISSYMNYADYSSDDDVDAMETEPVESEVASEESQGA